MEYILIIGSIVLAYIITNYFWTKFSKFEVKNESEPVAPYKVEPPVVPVVKVGPELKVVTGSTSRTKKTKIPVKSATKTPVKSATKTPVKSATKTPVKTTTTKTPVKSATKPIAKKSVKPRTKKPTDNA